MTKIMKVVAEYLADAANFERLAKKEKSAEVKAVLKKQAVLYRSRATERANGLRNRLSLFPETSTTNHHPDFSVVVKHRGRLPNPWRWEIYRAGKKTPVKQSKVFFSTVAEANRAGTKAFGLFMSEYPGGMI